MGPQFNVLITGCNRGIGLELVKQFFETASKAPTHLFATCRNVEKAGDLKNLAAAHPNITILEFDVTDHSKYDEITKMVNDVVGEDEGLNLLINNAGVLPANKTLETITPEDMRHGFEVNCLAPLFLTKAFLPLLKKAASKGADERPMGIHRSAVIQMSTAVASLDDNKSGNSYAYRCSKVALNMAMRNLAIDLKKFGILVMAMHPGWVLTDMGGPDALIDTITCCSTMVKTLEGLTEKDHGTFLRYNNTPVSW